MQETPAIIAGNGESEETPIQFEPCDVKTRVRAEREFISRRFGQEGVDWNRGMHFTRFDSISHWEIELADGTGRSVYFDSSVSYDIE